MRTKSIRNAFALVKKRVFAIACTSICVEQFGDER